MKKKQMLVAAASAEQPRWMDIFVPHKRYAWIGSVRDAATEVGYPYFLWQGWIYDTASGIETMWTLDDSAAIAIAKDTAIEIAEALEDYQVYMKDGYDEMKRENRGAHPVYTAEDLAEVCRKIGQNKMLIDTMAIACGPVHEKQTLPANHAGA